MMRVWKWTTLHISELIFSVVSTSDLVCWPSAIMLAWLACKPCQPVHHSELETIVFQLLIVVNQPISSCPPLSSAYTSNYTEDQWLLSDSPGQISKTRKVLFFCLIIRRNNLTFRPPWCDVWQCYTRWKVFFLSGKLFRCLWRLAVRECALSGWQGQEESPAQYLYFLVRDSACCRCAQHVPVCHILGTMQSCWISPQPWRAIQLILCHTAPGPDQSHRISVNLNHENPRQSLGGDSWSMIDTHSACLDSPVWRSGFIEN